MFKFNVNKLTPTTQDFPTFTFNVKRINPKPLAPTDLFRLKDKDGNYLLDKNGNKLFVRS